MKKMLKRTLKWTAGVLITLVAIVGIGTLLLNTNYVQQRLLKRATTILSERLGTNVKADSVSVNLFVPSVSLYGLRIDDQEGRPMLKMGEADARLTINSLWARDITVERLEANRLEALLIKAHSDSAANYQFLLDSLAKKPNEGKNKKKKSKKLSIDLHHFIVDHAQIIYQLENKKTSGSVALLDVEQEGEGFAVKVDSLHFTTNNNLPRKNANRPNKGWFDAGHLDITASLRGTIHVAKADTLALTLTKATIIDKKTGINIKDLRLKATSNMKKFWLKDIALKQGSTTLNIPNATFTKQPSPNTKFYFEAGVVSGNVVLRDIARPFAPVLQNFTLPLMLRTQVSGTPDMLKFSNVRVNTADKHLTIAANGIINHLREKGNLTVSFDVNSMKIKPGTAEKIIKLFPVKRLMMKQLNLLGDITYKGHFDVVGHSESFRGLLSTNCGPLNFNFTIDNGNQWINGALGSKAFRLGHVMELKDLGDVSCHADFKVDISKPRTAKMRQEKGGKLPIGTVTATIDDCSYKKTHVRNLDASIQCDGAVAEGDITQRGKRRDLYCHFAYTETQDASKLKISDPGIRFHKKNDSLDTKNSSKNAKQDETDGTKQKKDKNLLKRLFKKKDKE